MAIMQKTLKNMDTTDSLSSNTSVSNEDKKIRLSLDVTPQMKQIIDDLASTSGITQAEILRRAIALLRAVKKGEIQGESVVMEKDGQIVARLVGF
jgi:predicted DNA-binding protein